MASLKPLSTLYKDAALTLRKASLAQASVRPVGDSHNERPRQFSETSVILRSLASSTQQLRSMKSI